MGKTLCRLGLPLALGLALGIRLYVIYNLNFDGLYGQDSFAYFYHGFSLWHDHALEYHWPWLPTPTRLYWPMGYPMLLALAFSMAGHAAANAAQTITMCCGLAVIALTYGLTLRVSRAIVPLAANHAAAFCAAALIAFSGLQVQASVTIMSDAPALTWALLALWLWTTPPRGTVHRRLTSLLAGASLAAAISTRYEYAPLIAAPLTYWWVTSRASGVSKRSGILTPSLPFGLIGALCAGLPQLVYSAGYSAPILNNEWLTGWNLRHIWQARFSTPDGTQYYAHSVGSFYLIRPLVAPESLPWILAPFLPLGLLALAMNRDNSLALPPSRSLQSNSYLAMLLAWWLVPTFYLVGVPFESARFALVSQPALALGESIGLLWSASFLFSQLGKYGSIITTSAVVWVGCGLAVAATNSEGSVAVLARGKISDQTAVTWIREHVSAGSAIATFDLTLMLYHYGKLDTHHLRLYDLSAIDSADWVALSQARHVLVAANVGNLARQWAGLPPDVTFRRLITERRLTPIANAAAYTIFG